jgi:ADP-ribose pyrophosphatase YjhB (NUDIX family)/GNAT superfamily N-acetyltransferase
MSKRVALIVARRDDLVLFGRRSDNGRWTLPGGHLNEGEDPRAGARRELYEETGLDPEGELKLIDERETESGLKLYTYECTVAGAPSGKNDPDNECQLWAFLDVEDGIPKAVGENMQGPKNPDDNVAASVLGLAKMAIADIPAGAAVTPQNPPNPHKIKHDYNHVLTPEHRAEGYQLHVFHEPHQFVAILNKAPTLWEIGRVTGQRVRGNTIMPHSDLNQEHRGKGLGQAMYEAVFAHAYHNGYRNVMGRDHTPDAAKVQMKLAAKHGLAYKPGPQEFEESSEAGATVGPYSYTLKSEGPHPGRVYAALMRLSGRELAASCDEDELDPFTDEDEKVLEAAGLMKDGKPVELKKMALADVPYGTEHNPGDSDEVYGYDHVLTPEHRASGYRLRVVDNGGPTIYSYLEHHGNEVGNVTGEVSNRGRYGATIATHSGLNKPHHGLGVGKAMYEAILAHAHHNGIQRVKGEGPTRAALNVHHSLADKHGFEIEHDEDSTPSDEQYPNDVMGPYSYHLKNEKPIAKREHDDEIDRLLMHPSVSERSMALKLHGVNDKHLIRAIADDEPMVQKQALRHPNLGHHGLLALMQMPDREHLQHLALEHPLIGRQHIEALYHTHKDRPVAEKARIMHAISSHGHLDAPLIERMFKDGNGDALVDNLNTPAHVIEQLIEEHQLQPHDDKKRQLARRAFKHPHAPAHLVEHSFKNGPLDVKIAIAQSQHLPEHLAQDVLTRGHLPANDHEALLRTFIVQNPKATPRHLETAAKDRNPIVVHEARTRLGRFQKFEQGLNGFLGQLAKAIGPEDFKGIRSALDAAGAELVDHKPELTAHPAQHNADVAAYKQAILDNEKTVKRAAAAANNSDSRKTIYTVPATHPTHGGAKFMVKPYHERDSRVVKGWQKHPHQGWAEMTNQALYHAGGIGHLHQKVHVAEHNMGEGKEAEPALVIKMDSDGAVGPTPTAQRT